MHHEPFEAPADLADLVHRGAAEDNRRVVGVYERRQRRFRTVSQQEVFQRARGVGGHLLEQGLAPGRPALVFGHNSFDALVGFLATIAAGGLPTIVAARPAFDDRRRAGERLTALDHLLGDPLVVAVGDAAPELPDPLADRLLHVPDGIDRPCPRPDAAVDQVAHLQMTSGSTDAAKAVAVTHANVLANVAAIGAASGIEAGGADEGALCWVPLYHDMGLVGLALFALVSGVDLQLMTPFDFLAEPMAWMRSLSDTRATLSGGPNFAFDLVLRRGGEPDGLDLGHVKALYCGAEPVDAATMRGFQQRFGPSGLPADSPAPAFGLAESTLLVTSPARGRPARTLTVDAGELAGLDRLSAGRLASVCSAGPAPVPESGADIEVALLGGPVPGTDIQVVAEDGTVLTEDGAVGEVVVAGPCVTPGYRRADGSLDPVDPVLGFHTGDLGFWWDGELAVVERQKQVIIRNGHNHSSGALELQLAASTGLTLDRVVVVDSDIRGGQGRLTALLEADRRVEPDDLCRRAVAEAPTLRPPVERVVVVKAGTLARTTSGKKRHAEIRRALAAGELKELAASDVLIDLTGPTGRGRSDGDLEPVLVDLLGEQMRRRGVQRVPAAADHLVDDLGLDSLAILEIALELEVVLDVHVPEERLQSLEVVADLQALCERTPTGAGLGQRLRELQEAIPQLHLDVSDQQGRQVLVDGRWRSDFASCNYLGLDLHPAVAAAIPPMIRRWGTHPSWTRAVASPEPYRRLEERLADVVGARHTVVFPTVTLLHAGVLPRIARRGTVLIDAAAHASLHQATALAAAGGATIEVFPHDDLDDLGERLERVRGPVVVAVDGVYSMSGRTAPLADLARLTERHGALLYVDDAHGFGVLGADPTEGDPYGRGGGGVLRHLGLAGREGIVYVAGLSKAYSSMGAFVAGDALSRRDLREASTLVFGGPVPVASLATALAGLDVNHEEGDGFRRRLFELTARLVRGLRAAGHDVDGDLTFPIVNVPVGSLESVVRACQVLWEHDLVVTPAVYPAMPLDRGGVRFTVTAANTESEIDRAVEAMAAVRRDEGALLRIG